MIRWWGKMALTTKRIGKLNKRGRYRDDAVRGLCLQVGDNGNKSWLLRYERDGRDRYLGLGPLAIVDLKTARERARTARLQLLDGIDTIDAKRAARTARKVAAAKVVTLESFTNGRWQRSTTGTSDTAGRTTWHFELGKGAYKIRARAGGAVSPAIAITAL